MDSDDDSYPFDDDSSYESSLDQEEEWLADIQKINENDPLLAILAGDGASNVEIQNMNDEGWEELGRAISNNTHLEALRLNEGALNDQKIRCLFRGLTRSNSIQYVRFADDGLSVVGVQSMVPFLQHANNLKGLDLGDNNLQSEGFNVMFRALHDNPIECLRCNRCGIESIEIDSDHIPKHLTGLYLDGNNINTDGCRGLAKLLQGGDSTLTELYLYGNKIGDDGVEILVNALQNNTSLTDLDVRENDGISDQGGMMLLKLVNNISSVKATLQSNHTLTNLSVKLLLLDAVSEIQARIDVATLINRNQDNPEAAGREKVIQTQLRSANRAELCRLQGVHQSLHSEINPLHLPEVLSLVSQKLGHRELYVALKSSIAGVISIVNRKEYIKEQMAYHAAKLEELSAQLVATNAVEWGGSVRESHSNNLRRDWIALTILQTVARQDTVKEGRAFGRLNNKSLPQTLAVNENPVNMGQDIQSDSLSESPPLLLDVSFGTDPRPNSGRRAVRNGTCTPVRLL
eukprot:scaffold10364_cov155-Skeletonema_dohrnii-CCMP3373.AAC.4